MTDLQDKITTEVGIPRVKAPEPTLGSDPIIFGERYYSQEFASNEWGSYVDEGLADCWTS